MSRIALTLTLSLSLLVSLLLAACGSDEHQDVKQWMQDSSKDIKGRVLPLPEIKPFPIVSYDAGGLLDPFSASKIEPEKKPSSGGSGLKPDFNRFKEPLESYPLESLKMVGVLKQGKMRSAIILADKTAHTVKMGNYMGQNFGMVVGITDTEVQLRELIQDPSNDWAERATTLQLQEQETKK